MSRAAGPLAVAFMAVWVLAHLLGHRTGGGGRGGLTRAPALAAGG